MSNLASKPSRHKSSGDHARERIVAYMAEYQQQNYAPPTLRQVAAQLGIGITTVHYHCNRMVQLGIVRNLGGRRGYLAVPGGQ